MRFSTDSLQSNTLIHFEGPWTHEEARYLVSIAQMVHDRCPVNDAIGKPWVCTCNRGSQRVYYFANHVAKLNTILSAQTVADLAVQMIALGHLLNSGASLSITIN